MSTIALDYGNRYTYADYKNWDLPRGERWELVYGTPHLMASPGIQHQLILVDLLRQFSTFLYENECKVLAAPCDVRIFCERDEEDEEDDTVVQPDLLVICETRKLGKNVCLGAPDLAVEILSPSTSSYDCIEKFNLYRDAGVRELWIVDPARKVVIVNVLREGGRYESKTYTESEEVPVTILPGLVIKAAW